MKLEINLNDEPAFLNEIKKFIMDNVKGIARNEFEKQIKEIYAEKLNSALPNNLSLSTVIDNAMKTYIKEAVANALQNGNTYDNGKTEIRTMIRAEISSQVKDMLEKRDF